ncbi:hypothetical protein RRG08_012723 [Elysia crispata]|uniref:beta-glucosidase n=1 Tax=Elysia crispata TaxID=231223 RepID=A0AAE1B2U2_9GAST|nr:hypothetical protein RRG08_012723 [Elysia crispata]
MAEGYFKDRNISTYQDESWPTSGSSWLRVNPTGIRKNLNWIRQQYGEVPIYITENGVSARNVSLEDTYRISYYQQYINEVLKGRETTHFSHRADL